ncbi:4-diphosphocytidyl-2C-methyl-D-erythritol kinase [Rhodobacteraceae bacterium RKSG542]|uniref:NTP transferase domain-containing protein n=1 Tax=Pseudovibrio flavus TaxID=2529854 RepID=UPI0012BB4A76|nr:molybdopterin-binding/glycosyltransferase family 2 protein [Pseudovibrio flavus]MTI17815.1 4-diphosphocytidyl-2C-methyl-D-erythritol kinase [Pseudovibrio flavus]
MIYAGFALEDAEGCYLAHTLKAGDLTLKKGHHLTADDIANLAAQSVTKVTALKLEKGDVHEDQAATRVAKAARGDETHTLPAFTGRMNLYADQAGLLRIDADKINSANSISQDITIATLPDFEKVLNGRMIATAKIIPLAAKGSDLAKVEDAVRGAIKVAPFSAKRIGLVFTVLPQTKPSVLSKTRKVLEERLAPSGSSVAWEVQCAHDQGALREALADVDSQPECDLVIVFGASAVVDVNDVIPAAIIDAGGAVEHFGMPVDPGNLLVLGNLSGKFVIGAPGCARSAQENGFDWVLDRLLANIPVSSRDLMGMGVGGLLKEIHSRPQPRETNTDLPYEPQHNIAGLLLAAGKSTRMAPHNKLLARVDGIPLVRRVAENALGSGLSRLFVVTGHMEQEVKEALDGLPITFIDNPSFAEGMSTSIVAGVKHILDQRYAAAVVLLADMPHVSGEHIDQLINHYEPDSDCLIGVSSFGGKRGNPVLWDARYFGELTQLTGDIGGKALIQSNRDQVYQVEIGEAARIDLDDQTKLERIGGELGHYSRQKS